MDPIDLLDPIEVDRQRIGAEIHDGLLPYLFATAAKISALRRSNPELEKSMADIAEWVDRSREVARDLIRSVSVTEEVADDPLVAAKHFLDSIRVDAEEGPLIRWDWESHSPLKGRLGADVAAATYRIVCEAVRNSLRHANAEKIVINCQPEPASGNVAGFRVEIGDDGCGMDSTIETTNIETTKQQSGLAWMSMRAARSQIDLRVESKAGVGTSVCLKIPAGIQSDH